MGVSIVNFEKMADRLVGGPIKAACGDWGDFVVTIVAMSLILLVLRFLYQRKIFMRV